MAILVSQATADADTLSLTSEDASNTIYASNYADRVTLAGGGNFLVADISSGDTISIGQSGTATRARLRGNTITFLVGGTGTRTITLGGIADGESFTVRFGSGTFPDLTVARTGNDFFVGNTQLVDGADYATFLFIDSASSTTTIGQ